MDLDPNRPEQYPRRILLAVTGMSPQIVTETIYALAVKPPEGQEPFVPTEIHLITTGRGRTQAVNNLLLPRVGKEGWFHRLCADYGLPDMRFDESCIHVMTDDDGQPLEDIRTPEDNECAADFITEKVRVLTHDAAAALHVSLAGGRKTMGFYLGYALSLFARPQDQLSHVLVSAPYESQPGFYYPTPYDDVIDLPDKTSINTRHASISLAVIPVVSLRHGLDGLLTGQRSFKDTVNAARAALAPPELVIDVRNQRVCMGEQVLRPADKAFAILAVLAYRALQDKEPLRAPVKDATDAEWSRAFLADLHSACGDMSVSGRVEEPLNRGVSGSWFSEGLSKLKNYLQGALGPLSHVYRIDDGGGKPKRKARAR